MRLGITDMIGLAASLVFAIPLANYALVRLFAGEFALGAALLVVAAAMVALPQYFLDPGRILRGFLWGLLPRQLRGDPAASADATGPGSSRGDETDAEELSTGGSDAPER